MQDSDRKREPNKFLKEYRKMKWGGEHLSIESINSKMDQAEENNLMT